MLCACQTLCSQRAQAEAECAQLRSSVQVLGFAITFFRVVDAGALQALQEQSGEIGTVRMQLQDARRVAETQVQAAQVCSLPRHPFGAR